MSAMLTTELNIDRQFTKIVPCFGDCVLFYSSAVAENATGYGELRSSKLGLLRGLPKLHSGWTHICPIGKDALLFYERGTGKVEAYNQRFDLLWHDYGFHKEWDAIVPLGQTSSSLLFHDRSSGKAEIYTYRNNRLVVDWELAAKIGKLAIKVLIELAT